MGVRVVCLQCFAFHVFEYNFVWRVLDLVCPTESELCLIVSVENMKDLL